MGTKPQLRARVDHEALHKDAFLNPGNVNQSLNVNREIYCEKNKAYL